MRGIFSPDADRGAKRRGESARDEREVKNKEKILILLYMIYKFKCNSY